MKHRNRKRPNVRENIRNLERECLSPRLRDLLKALQLNPDERDDDAIHIADALILVAERIYRKDPETWQRIVLYSLQIRDSETLETIQRLTD